MASQRKRVAKMGEPVSTACWRTVLDGFGLKEVEDIGEREAVLLGERDVDAVVGGGGLQFEVEAAAEALAQGQSPGAVDARSEGCVDDQLHAAALVEEALGDDGALSGHGSEDGAALADVGGELAKGVGVDEAGDAVGMVVPTFAN